MCYCTNSTIAHQYIQTHTHESVCVQCKYTNTKMYANKHTYKQCTITNIKLYLASAKDINVHLTPASGGGSSQLQIIQSRCSSLVLLSFLIILDYQDYLDKFCAPVIMCAMEKQRWPSWSRCPPSVRLSLHMLLTRSLICIDFLDYFKLF